MDLAQAKKYITKSQLASVAIGLIFFSLPLYAHAASLYISPALKNVTVGQTFTLSAYVSSPTQSMNAASGDISFPSNKVQVLSISKANSIISLWIRDPSFTNSVDGGDINFQGIVLNPGYIGPAGNLITVTFQAVGVGSAAITFSSGAVLANDGNGTNILNGLEGASVQISPRPIVPAQPSSGTTSAITSTSSSTVTSTVTSSTTTSTITIPVTQATTTAPVVTTNSLWQKLFLLTTEWGVLALVILLLLAALIFIALLIIHRIRKWRIASSRDLLVLEETLRSDLKRIEKQLSVEKRGKDDPTRKAIEHVEADIKKDIAAIDEIKKK